MAQTMAVSRATLISHPGVLGISANVMHGVPHEFYRLLLKARPDGFSYDLRVSLELKINQTDLLPEAFDELIRNIVQVRMHCFSADDLFFVVDSIGKHCLQRRARLVPVRDGPRLPRRKRERLEPRRAGGLPL